MYENFYSMLNDPILKAEYEKQAMKTFEATESTQGTFKQKL
jgi:hypothetical protein